MYEETTGTRWILRLAVVSVLNEQSGGNTVDSGSA